jgi:hypothetical protein
MSKKLNSSGHRRLDSGTQNKLLEDIPNLPSYFIVYSQLEDHNGKPYNKIFNRIVFQHPIDWINEQNKTIPHPTVYLMLINWLPLDERKYKIVNAVDYKKYDGGCCIM